MRGLLEAGVAGAALETFALLEGDEVVVDRVLEIEEAEVRLQAEADERAQRGLL